MSSSGHFLKFVSRSVNFARFLQKKFVAQGLGSSALYLGKATKSTFFSARNKIFILSPFLVQIAALKFGKSKSTAEKVMEQADTLYEKRQFVELKQLLTEAKADDENILWRLARATYEVAKTNTNKEEQAKEMEEALAHAKKALELNENNGFAHKWCGILLNAVLDNRGIKEKITRATEIKDHLENAVRLLPDDATSYHILGVWCFSVADLSWYERKLASVIFATPPTSSYNDALGYFEKAETMKPLFFSSNLLYLGKCYMRLNEKDKAKEAFIKARDYPQEKPEDEKVKDEAVTLLKKLG